MKRFTNHPEPWGDFVDVKYWKPIKNPQKYSGKELFLGSVTDPYQPCEEKFRRTRALLEEMLGSGCKISIATKSDLVLRDLDIIKKFPDARVSFSINTLDENFQKDMDLAVSIERRIRAMKILHDAGIRSTCFISPIFPKITDIPAIIERTMERCNLIWLENLNLRGDYRSRILNYIHEKYPALDSLYRKIYLEKDRSYWAQLDSEIRDFTSTLGLIYTRNDDSIQNSDRPIVVNYFFHEELVR